MVMTVSTASSFPPTFCKIPEHTGIPASNSAFSATSPPAASAPAADSTAVHSTPSTDTNPVNRLPLLARPRLPHHHAQRRTHRTRLRHKPRRDHPNPTNRRPHKLHRVTSSPNLPTRALHHNALPIKLRHAPNPNIPDIQLPPPRRQ